MNKNLLITASLVSMLSACGGGGDSGNSASQTPGTSTAIVMRNIVLNPADILAETTYNGTRTALLTDFISRSFAKLEAMIIPNAYATTGCGRLCSPAYPPVNIDTQQNITQKIVSGSIAPIQVIFDTEISGQNVACDFTNVQILVNKIWITNLSTNDFIANLSTPKTVDSNCNVTYSVADYFISGSTSNVYKLDTQLTGTIKDVIPAGDPAFNTSGNPLVVNYSGQVSDISIDNTGAVTQTELTTPSVSVKTYMGSITYNGTHLMAIADSINDPVVVFTKGSAAFQLFRPNSGTYHTVFINSDGDFIFNDVYKMYKLNPTTLATSDYAPSAQPSAMFGANGRYQTWLMSDRCVVWNTANGDWANLWFYPQYTNVDPWRYNEYFPGNPPNTTFSYARLSDKYAYCVDGTLSNYVRYDVTQGTGVSVNLSNYGYIASGYQIYSNVAYATVTNTNNSDVQYIQINLNDGAVTNLGVITAGTRKVISLTPIQGIS